MLEGCAEALEEAGFATAADIYVKELSDDIEGVKKPQLKLIKAIAKGSGSDPAAERGYVGTDRIRIHDDFYLRFAIADDSIPARVSSSSDSLSARLEVLSKQFAEMLTDPLGRSTISLAQLAGHLAKFTAGAGLEEATKCIEAVPAALTKHVRAEKVEKPPPPAPTEWVYGWLKEHSLEEYAKQFIGARLTTREDLASEPKLTGEVLEKKIGIKPHGDCRRLEMLIAAL